MATNDVDQSLKCSNHDLELKKIDWCDLHSHFCCAICSDDELHNMSSNWQMAASQNLPGPAIIRLMLSFLERCSDSPEEITSTQLNEFISAVSLQAVQRPALQKATHDGFSYTEILVSLLSFYIDKDISEVRSQYSEASSSRIRKLCSSIFYLLSSSPDMIPEVLLGNLTDVTPDHTKLSVMVLNKLSTQKHSWSHLGYTKYIALCKHVRSHCKSIGVKRAAIDKLVLGTKKPSRYLRFIKPLSDEVYQLLSVNKSTIGWTMYTECGMEDLLDLIASASAKPKESVDTEAVDEAVDATSGPEASVEDEMNGGGKDEEVEEEVAEEMETVIKGQLLSKSLAQDVQATFTIDRGSNKPADVGDNEQSEDEETSLAERSSINPASQFNKAASLTAEKKKKKKVRLPSPVPHSDEEEQVEMIPDSDADDRIAQQYEDADSDSGEDEDNVDDEGVGNSSNEGRDAESDIESDAESDVDVTDEDSNEDSPITSIAQMTTAADEDDNPVVSAGGYEGGDNSPSRSEADVDPSDEEMLALWKGGDGSFLSTGSDSFVKAEPLSPETRIRKAKRKSAQGQVEAIADTAVYEVDSESTAASDNTESKQETVGPDSPPAPKTPNIKKSANKKTPKPVSDSSHGKSAKSGGLSPSTKSPKAKTPKSKLFVETESDGPTSDLPSSAKSPATGDPTSIKSPKTKTPKLKRFAETESDDPISDASSPAKSSKTGQLSSPTRAATSETTAVEQDVAMPPKCSAMQQQAGADVLSPSASSEELEKSARLKTPKSRTKSKTPKSVNSSKISSRQKCIGDIISSMEASDELMSDAEKATLGEPSSPQPNVIFKDTSGAATALTASCEVIDITESRENSQEHSPVSVQLSDTQEVISEPRIPQISLIESEDTTLSSSYSPPSALELTPKSGQPTPSARDRTLASGRSSSGGRTPKSRPRETIYDRQNEKALEKIVTDYMNKKSERVASDITPTSDDKTRPANVGTPTSRRKNRPGNDTTPTSDRQNRLADDTTPASERKNRSASDVTPISERTHSPAKDTTPTSARKKRLAKDTTLTENTSANDSISTKGTPATGSVSTKDRPANDATPTNIRPVSDASSQPRHDSPLTSQQIEAGQETPLSCDTLTDLDLGLGTLSSQDLLDDSPTLPDDTVFSSAKLSERSSRRSAREKVDPSTSVSELRRSTRKSTIISEDVEAGDKTPVASGRKSTSKRKSESKSKAEVTEESSPERSALSKKHYFTKIKVAEELETSTSVRKSSRLRKGEKKADSVELGLPDEPNVKQDSASATSDDSEASSIMETVRLPVRNRRLWKPTVYDGSSDDSLSQQSTRSSRRSARMRASINPGSQLTDITEQNAEQNAEQAPKKGGILLLLPAEVAKPVEHESRRTRRDSEESNATDVSATYSLRKRKSLAAPPRATDPAATRRSMRAQSVSSTESYSLRKRAK